MKEQTLLSIVAILAVVILESVALWHKIDGAIFMSSLALVGAIAGYELKTIKDKLIKKKSP